jgi:hypothetical protein
MKFKIKTILGIFVSAIMLSGTVTAQSNYRASNGHSGDVTVYEHCDFGGKSQTIRPGEYRKMRDAGFGNDSVSSIRVPQGSQVTLYENDDYRGSFAHVDQDIRCFDRQWNNSVSSLSITDSGYSQRGNDRNQYDANVTAENVSQVVFDGVSLQQVAAKQWSMDRNRGASTQFDETRRDRDSVYLENKYTTERVRIDLFANDVSVVDRDGRQQRYGIDRKNAGIGSLANDARQTSLVPVSASSDNRRINADCFNFKAYTKGGNASLRFLGKKGLYRFSNRGSAAKICHKGSLTMEIGKTEPGTTVIVEINGNRYTFAAGEKEDQLRNNWYRKSIRLSVGR